MQILEAVFSKEAINSPFGYQVEKISELTSDLETRTHILIASPKLPIKAGLKDTKYLIYIRRTGITEERIATLEELASRALGSLVPNRVHSGSFWNDLLGHCPYVLYTLEDTEDEIFSLSKAWDGMSSIQRNSIIAQVMDCRSKMREIKLEKVWPGQLPRVPKGVPGGARGMRVEHPSFNWKKEDVGQYNGLLPLARRHDPSLWRTGMNLHNSLTWEDLPSLLALLEPFVADQGAALLPVEDDHQKIRIRPDDRTITPTVFTEMYTNWINSPEGNFLQHCGLNPENILVTKHRRPCMPSKYRIFSVVGWHEALFAPPGYDIGFHDSRLGSREGGDHEDGSFYEKFRPLAMSPAFLKEADEYMKRWPVRKLVEVMHNLAEFKELARPASAPRDGLNPFPRRTGWLGDNNFVWMGVEKGYVRRDPLV